jgi:hypothetical protein
MQYRWNSYHLEYRNSKFDSALELTWFLFLEQIKITKNNLSSQPLDYKFELGWYPDLRFVIFNPKHNEIFAEIKPLNKTEFEKELSLSKYKYNDNKVCILGNDNTEYLFINDNEELSKLFDIEILPKVELWESCKTQALEIARKLGSNIGHSVPKLDFGKYKGYTLKEIQIKDPSYYKWYMETFD